MQESDVGYIYIIINLDSDILRVGRTKDGSYKRPQSQRAYLPFKTLFYGFKLNNYLNVETDLHRILKKFKLRGDWYKFPPVGLINFIINDYNVLEYTVPKYGMSYLKQNPIVKPIKDLADEWIIKKPFKYYEPFK